MTYCVALKLREGMVFLSDTRTNAGMDNISRVKKLFTWKVPGERCFVCIMFLDIRDFTPMAEKLSPEEIIEYQNNVFGFKGNHTTFSDTL